MIEVLLGSRNAERVLIYIYAREEGYAREIARFYKTGLLPIQKQLDKLEAGGVLASRAVGKTRPYVFNPRYPFLNELKALLEKALSFYPADEQDELVMKQAQTACQGQGRMKHIRRMNQVELAAFIQSQLNKTGIDTILSGGSAVSFYSENKYVSKDLDLINAKFARRRDINSVMEKIGFRKQGRYFTHPDTEFFVEFPDGPLSVGKEPVKEIDEFNLPTGTLRVISATDCVKDRLCAFYFWNDQQGLAQAVLVSKSQKVDLKEIKRWSKAEGKIYEFDVFRKKLS